MTKAETRTRPHFERALFVVGNPNAGKSTLLRNMFVDVRFGTDEQVPDEQRIMPTFALSNERCLKVRFTSPHEMKETIEQFFSKVDREMERAWTNFFRFNFACPLQPTAANRMPDVATVCDLFRQRFQPERMRIVQIDPEWTGARGTLLADPDVRRLRRLRIELATVDAQESEDQPYTSGIFLADFFDFT